jgi:hypothetical protein
MKKSDTKQPPFVIKQLEEALEERQGADRRKANEGVNPDSGEDRRKGDRRTPKH